MTKRRLLALAMAAALAVAMYPVGVTAVGTEVTGNGKVAVSVSEDDPCAVTVEWRGSGDPDVRLRVARADAGGATYMYRLSQDAAARVTFPEGSGSYRLTVLQHTRDRYYSVVYSAVLDVEIDDLAEAFLGSTAMVRYTGDEDFICVAGELCGDCGTRTEAILAVYDYVTDYMSYDRDKAKQIVSGAWTGGAVPDLEHVYETGEGVCYDIAGLTAAMLRSQGVPCMLVYGYAGDVYHAWCLAMPDEDGIVGGVAVTGGEWSLIDPTFGLGNERMVRTYLAAGKYEPVLTY